MSGRYGLVALFRPGTEGEDGLQGYPLNTETIALIVGNRGSLIAVLDGQEIDLGSGKLFTEFQYDIIYVGLKPDEPREENWLNVDNLYKVDGIMHHRTIELYFQPR
jgi:hypothetical protein